MALFYSQISNLAYFFPYWLQTKSRQQSLCACFLLIEHIQHLLENAAQVILGPKDTFNPTIHQEKNINNPKCFVPPHLR